MSVNCSRGSMCLEVVELERKGKRETRGMSRWQDAPCWGLLECRVGTDQPKSNLSNITIVSLILLFLLILYTQIFISMISGIDFVCRWNCVNHLARTHGVVNGRVTSSSNLGFTRTKPRTRTHSSVQSSDVWPEPNENFGPKFSEIGAWTELNWTELFRH